MILSEPMSHRVLSIAGSFFVAVGLVAVPVSAVIATAATAQTTDAKPAEQQPAAPADAAKEPQKVDEYAEAQRLLGGPAGNPECVWLGRRVVSLLWRDDLDTAFRHLDLYDRFGCPSGHIQATFRCLVLHANTIDPKAADSLNGRVYACWINPSLQDAPAPAPAAAAASPSTPH
jgi:pyruvate/2-oxoglutarate dehydrogenase complex dihydrolipoamide acyltransferase (E2) component